MTRKERLTMMLGMYKNAKKSAEGHLEKQRLNREICNIKKELKAL